MKIFDSVDELNRNDYFNIYINSLVKQFDPHSFYFFQMKKKLLTQVYLVRRNWCSSWKKKSTDNNFRSNLWWTSMERKFT